MFFYNKYVDHALLFSEYVSYSICEGKEVTVEEFTSFFQFLNNVDVYAVASNMHNFASYTAGQNDLKNVFNLAAELKPSSHLVNNIFKIFYSNKDE